MKLKHGDNKFLWIIYIIIFLICVFGIGVAVYLQFYKGANIKAVIGINDEDSEKEDEYNALKAEFPSLFNNKLEVLQDEKINIEKLSNDYDIIVTAYSYEKEDERCNLKAYIPYMNIKKENTININKKIKEEFKDIAEGLNNSTLNTYTIYTVTYKAYIQKDILSLVVRSELKEGNQSQKIKIRTYNYDIKNDKELTISDLLSLKEISISGANEKIKNEISKIQEQNDALEQALNGQGSLYKRDIESEIYNIENTSEFFLGRDGMLYLIYAYGNIDLTSEMDIVIFK